LKSSSVDFTPLFRALLVYIVAFLFYRRQIIADSVEEVKAGREHYCANAVHDTIAPTGAWCLEHFNNMTDHIQVENKEDWEKFQAQEPRVGARIFPRLGSQHHVPPDISFGKGMIHLLENFADHCAPLAPGAHSSNHTITVVDVGAGIGQYGAVFETYSSRILWRGYDGAGNVENFTNGRVKWFDATDVALDTINGLADWVVSLEIAEVRHCTIFVVLALHHR